MPYLQRSALLMRIQQAFRVNRIVCLLGPRQCGKTTLARTLWKNEGKSLHDPGYFDLEKPSDIVALEMPDLVLSGLEGLIVIDEIQRKPDLFSYLRYLHDENRNQRILILGSATKDLIHQSSESLAGRISYIEVTPFSLDEVPNWQQLWAAGGFPKSYLSEPDISVAWRESYMRTYVEQDLANLGFAFHEGNLRKLWFMLAHYHGQTLNASELATSLGVSQPTVTRYLSYLSGSFMIRQLQPWFENIKKRQVKSPKIYYRDSGLLHYVLGIQSINDIFTHPKAGASWEGFAIEEIIKFYGEDAHNCYFWASHNDAELDLLIVREGKKNGFEFKLSDAPKLTPSMRIAMDDLKLDSLTVIYPGTRSYSLTEKIKVCPLTDFCHKPALL
jgi:predicted AAA+ superfamily ATPase